MSESMYHSDSVNLLIKANDRLTKDVSKISDKLDKLSDLLLQLAVMTERLDNHEKKDSDSHNRLHHRVDEAVTKAADNLAIAERRLSNVEDKCEINTKDILKKKEMEDSIILLKNKVDKLELLIIVSERPYLMLGFGLVLYLFAIKDLRDMLFQFMGIM